MSADTIRNISSTLARHQELFERQGGFDRPQDQTIYYLGYGGRLGLPNGTTYETYASGVASGALELAFIGPSSDVPGLRAELGRVTLTATEENRVAIKGKAPDYVASDCPALSELVRPFGTWIVDTMLRETERLAGQRRIQEGRSNKLDALSEAILLYRGGNGVTELDLLESSVGIVAETIRAGRDLRSAPETIVPSDRDVTSLGNFLASTANVTAGYVHICGPNGAPGLQIIHAAGPLLS